MAIEDEALRRDFTPLDGPLLRHCLKETNLEGEWPEQYAKAILSLFDSDLVLYLTPLLVMREPAGSLLAQTNRLVVARQQAYARSLGIPWAFR